VKFQGQLTEVFGIEGGSRRGEALSKTMFHTVLAEVIRNIRGQTI